MGLGRLALRGVIGLLFVGHGTQKLFGWFGGGGLGGTAASMEQVGLRPGRRHAVTAGTAETAGGLLLLTGAATPAAACALSSVMLTAIRTVHRRNGVWASNGGLEYPAVMLAALLAVTEAGPGPLSVDAARGRERRGAGWALAQLGLAALASHAVVTRGRRVGPAVVTPEEHEHGAATEPLRRAA